MNSHTEYAIIYHEHSHLCPTRPKIIPTPQAHNYKPRMSVTLDSENVAEALIVADLQINRIHMTSPMCSVSQTTLE